MTRVSASKATSDYLSLDNALVKVKHVISRTMDMRFPSTIESLQTHRNIC